MSWKGAARDHETFCVSCHTVLPYALARSALGTPRVSTVEETRLIDNVSKRTELWNETGPYYSSTDRAPNRTAESRGTEAVLNAVVLAVHDAPTGHLSQTTRTAFANMWSTQLRVGSTAGSWPWLDFSLEPWEAPESQYFGAAMALRAVNMAPEGYRSGDAIQKNLSSLQAYLLREYSRQSLLNRSVLLWAAAGNPSQLDSMQRRATVNDLMDAQRSDGGWGLASLIRGHFFADPRHYLHSWINSSGIVNQSSDGYATGLAVIVLLGSGTPRHDPAIDRAVSWLTQNQDPEGGSWAARSLNQRRDPDSVAGHFMTDASTAFASLALAEAAANADVEGRNGIRATAAALLPVSRSAHQ